MDSAEYCFLGEQICFSVKLFSFRNKNIPASVSGDRFGFPVFRFGFDVVLKIVQIVFLVEELRAVPGYRDFFGAFEVHFKLSSC